MNLAVGRTRAMLLAAFVASLVLLAGGVGSARAADGDILFKQCVSDSGSGGNCADGTCSAWCWESRSARTAATRT